MSGRPLMAGDLWRRPATGAVAAAMALVGLAGPASAAPAQGSPQATVTRAAVPAGAINHVLVIDLENEGYATTFGPSSPATYLNGTLRKQGELVQNYYGIGHASLDNYIAKSRHRPQRRRPAPTA